MIITVTGITKQGKYRVLCRCDNCNSEYNLRYSRVRGNYQFCSYRCRGEWRRNNFKTYKNSNWRGGITSNRHGYILIKKREHPYCDNSGYVLEHRLIMEKYLGRYLKPKEVVHHINGIHDDNRIENLLVFKNNGEHKKWEHAKGLSLRAKTGG